MALQEGKKKKKKGEPVEDRPSSCRDARRDILKGKEQERRFFICGKEEGRKMWPERH